MARGYVSKRCPCGVTGTRGTKRKAPTPACRKDHGSWTYVITVGRDPGTGKQVQKRRSGFATEKEANKALTAELRRLDMGAWENDGDMTVGQWLTEWLARREAAGLEVKTLAGYRTNVAEWSALIGHRKLRDLRRHHVEAALVAMRTPPAREKNVGRPVEQRSPGTLDAKRRTLRAALASAVLNNLIEVNCAEGTMDAIPRGRRSSKPQMWEPDQLDAYLEHARSDRLFAGLVLASFAGLRRGEVMGATWDALDSGWDNLEVETAGLWVRATMLEPGQSAVPARLRRCPGCGVEHRGLYWKQNPKTAAGERWVPLVVEARQALLAHKAEQDEHKRRLGAAYVDHGLVFAEPDGNPIRPSSLSAAHRAHAEAIGDTSMHLHMMRHSACSRMLAGGMGVDVVRLILGHSSAAVTMSIYAHVQRGKAAQQMEAALGRGRGNDQNLTSHRRVVPGGRSGIGT